MSHCHGFISLPKRNQDCECEVQDSQNSALDVESNRGTEIASFTRRIVESASATMSVFSSRFLILLDFTRYVYEFVFREKVYLSEAHSGRGMRATSKELRDR